MKQYKMKVEIWSDIVCPFCYIGKRRFETALSQFNQKDSIEIVWKSFQLAPDLKTDPNKSIYDILAEHKGMSLEQAKNASDQVATIASQDGLVYNFDKVIPANSFNANRLSQLAKHHGLQDKAEESLFKAYFTEGKNIDDISKLIQIGEEIGLNKIAVQTALESDQYAEEVEQDLSEAKQTRVTALPYFLFNSKLAVSGAKDSAVFLTMLESSFTEWEREQTELKMKLIDDQTCKVGEVC